MRSNSAVLTECHWKGVCGCRGVGIGAGTCQQRTNAARRWGWGMGDRVQLQPKLLPCS